MAASRNNLQLILFIIQQFSLLTALTLQLNGLIIAYKLLEAKRYMAVGAYLCTKKTICFERRNMQNKDFFIENQKLLGRKGKD